MLPSGDIGPGGTATLDVYNCGRGAFRLVAIGRDNTKLTLARDGTTVATTDLWPRGVWSQTIPTTSAGDRSLHVLALVQLARPPAAVRMDARGRESSASAVRSCPCEPDWRPS